MLNAKPSREEYKKKHWSDVNNSIFNKFIEYISKTYGVESFEVAFHEFYLYGFNQNQYSLNHKDAQFNPNSPEMQLFFPWMFYEWRPNQKVQLENNHHQDGRLREGLTIGQSLELMGNNLSKDEREYLLSCFKTTFSFFEIIEINLDVSLKLKDIFTEELHLVLEKNATHGVRVGNLLYAKIVRLEDIVTLEATCSIVIDPIYKIHVLELKDKIQKVNKVVNITVDILRLHSIEILKLYRSIYERVINPPMPILKNSDGDLLAPHRLIYDIQDSHVTFESIYRFCYGNARDELIDGAKVDNMGRVVFVQFPWLKGVSGADENVGSTVLGNIQIDGSVMTVEVNSRERYLKFNRELKKLMPEAGTWKLKYKQIESVESFVAKARNIEIKRDTENVREIKRDNGKGRELKRDSDKGREIKRDQASGIDRDTQNYENKGKDSYKGIVKSSKVGGKEQTVNYNEIMANPEVRNKIQSMLQAHWDNWLMLPIPALGGKSPIDAAKSKLGREKLDSLLTSYEITSESEPMLGQTDDFFKNLRAKLGI